VRHDQELVMSASAGIHHVTAICHDPKTNVMFYTRSLGLRMVKKTVNFDDPTTWHLYYGDETGRPGTALTFFAWDGLPPGRNGNGWPSKPLSSFLSARSPTGGSG
jgi:glyoxalase family protein